MTPAALLFRAGAFVALILLVRHAVRTEGRRAAAVLVAYLAAMGLFHEWVVPAVARAIGGVSPYYSDPGFAQVGGVNVVVAVGWVFTALVSFGLARMIQRRNFPGTNVFLTLALTAVVTTSISYPVEVIGVRMHFWGWRTTDSVEWLPFAWPFDAFEGWATTTFFIMLVYCAGRYRLFSARRWLAVAVALALVCGIMVDAERPWKVIAVYLALSTGLGFVAPRAWLGSSDEVMRPT